MKNTTLTLAILMLGIGFIYAGPEPLPSGKEMKQVAPAPPPCPTWTGFYVGIMAGFKLAETDVDVRLTDDWDAFPVQREVAEGEGQGADVDADGAELGGLIGFNYQWHNFVFGVEAAGGYLWLRDSDVTNFSIFGQDWNVETSFKTHYLTTIGGRFGYTFCRWMPYVTGGVAIGDIDFEQRYHQHPAFFNQGGSTSETQVGWMVGGGLEFALTDHWHLRGQYQYVDLGSAGFEHDTTDPDFFGHSDIDLREHNVSLAIIYKF
jgi:outer membrane immunogenic protein